jgi:hypothetical protein
LALLLAACTAPSIASASDTERIIVTNARLVSREAAGQDVAVNVVIVDGKLSVVTKHDLVVGTAKSTLGGRSFPLPDCGHIATAPL